MAIPRDVPEAPQTSGEIDQCLQIMLNTLQKHMACVDNLVATIDPVLTPMHPSQETECCVPDYGSPLAQRLDELNTMLASTTTKVNSVMERVAL